jgi:hypothetical protein
MECSSQDNQTVEVEFDNTCGFAIDVYWVNYFCEEEFYQAISAGNSWSTTSYATHPWRVRDAKTGALILEIPPLQANTTVVVQ